MDEKEKEEEDDDEAAARDDTAVQRSASGGSHGYRGRRSPAACSTLRFVCAQMLFLLTGFACGGATFVGVHRFANAAVRHATGMNMMGTRGEMREKAEAEARAAALEEAAEAKRRAAFRRHHGGSDDPEWFTGRVGGPLEGGGEDWQDKLPAELQHITSHAELAHKVVWASRTSIMEIASGRIWQRVGADWLQVFEATAGKRKAPAGDRRANADAVDAAYKNMKTELQRKTKLLEIFEKEEALRRIKQEKEDNKLVALLKGNKGGAASKRHLGAKVWVICSKVTPGTELSQLCAKLKAENAIGITVDDLTHGRTGRGSQSGSGGGGGRLAGRHEGERSVARVSEDIKAALRMAAKSPKVAERVVELCLAAPRPGELRELCYRWSVQRLAAYPVDKAKAEEEYWVQRDVERMNNRTAAAVAKGKLRGNDDRNTTSTPSPPPPFDWKSFPWAEDPDKDLPDSEQERIERLEEKAMLEEGKAEEEGWDSGPRGGGVADTEGAQGVNAAADEDREGEEPIKEDNLPVHTRWGVTEEDEEEAGELRTPA